MAYRIESHEEIPSAIKRIIKEQIQQAIDVLSGSTDSDKDEAVHEARKRFKEIRGVLRLVRDEIGEDIYKRENVYFRDTARRLSDLRDTQVFIETLDDLQEHFEETIASDAFVDVRDVLKDYHSSVYQQLIEQGNEISLVVNVLKAAQNRIDNLPIKQNNWSVLDSGLKRVYRRGYKDFDQACDEPTVENLHEWRKRVKYLWYHTQILQLIWSDLMVEFAEQLHDLSNYLGDDHDLAVLHEFINTNPERFENCQELEVLVALINRRRKQLQLDAKLLGQRIYAEKPKRFVKRIGAYWQAWQQERDLA